MQHMLQIFNTLLETSNIYGKSVNSTLSPSEVLRV